jgi:hypothetical protein
MQWRRTVVHITKVTDQGTCHVYWYGWLLWAQPMGSDLQCSLVSVQRFNVAITRARSLLIIVGNPHLLECDPNWRELINFTQKLGSYRGCHYMPRREPRSEWVKEVVKRLGRISED